MCDCRLLFTLFFCVQANSFVLKTMFAEYGKGYIKKKKLSPDGYLQVKHADP